MTVQAPQGQFQMSNEGYQTLGTGFQMQQPLLFYQIHGRPAFSYGDVYVQPNTRVIADGEAMLWVDGSLAIDTECYGGCFAACARTCSGEPCCFNMFSGSGKVSFGFDTPGDMLSFGVHEGNGWLLTSGAFIAGTDNLVVSSKFGGCLACCCADEGPFLTTVNVDKDAPNKNGVFLAGSYGMLERHDIPQGKVFYTRAGTFFATHSSGTLNVGQVGGLCNFCFGAGWKSIVLRFNGPCTVYTQSRNPRDLYRLQTAAQQQEDGNRNDKQQKQQQQQDRH